MRAWRRLRWSERVELSYLVLLALLAEAAVRLIPLPTLTRRLGIALGRNAGEPGPPGAHAPFVERRARAVDRLYRVWPRDGSCLRRALVLGFRVRRARPTLVLGVAEEDGTVHAHAWIEVDGAPVGHEPREFSPLRSARSRNT